MDALSKLTQGKRKEKDLEEFYNEDIFIAVRYGVRKMTDIQGVPVKQEDKELMLRAHIGAVNDIPGKTSFVLLNNAQD